MPTKPVPLQIAMLLLLGLGVGLGIGLLLAPLDLRIYSLDEGTIGGREFARLVGLPASLMAVSFSLAGWGLLRDRTWSRPAILASVASLGIMFSWGSAIAPGGYAVDGHLVATPILVGVAAWYLHFAEGPKAYYAALSHRERVAPN
jgi:hypothetical protein